MYAAEQTTTPSRDWSVLPEDEIIDQATDLPEHFTLDANVSRLLDNRAEFGVWLRNVTRLLQEKGLEKLIDIRIARPFRQSAIAKRWVEYSRKIQHWLTQNMAEELIQEIIASSNGKRIQLADEFVEQAKKTFQAPGVYADMEGVASFMSLNMSSFASARDFAWGFKDQFNTMWEKKGVQIPPYFALCMLLNRLDNMEHRYVVASTISELNARATQGDLWTTFTTVDFHVTVFNIIQRLEKTGKAAIVPTLTRLATNEASQRIPSFHRQGTPPPGVKYFPPIGANEDDYAEGLRQSLPQITKDKNCAYCGQKYHIASKCYYLNPETRPSYWRPLGDIWTYKKGQYAANPDENLSFYDRMAALDLLPSTPSQDLATTAKQTTRQDALETAGQTTAQTPTTTPPRTPAYTAPQSAEHTPTQASVQHATNATAKSATPPKSQDIFLTAPLTDTDKTNGEEYYADLMTDNKEESVPAIETPEKKGEMKEEHSSSASEIPGKKGDMKEEDSFSATKTPDSDKSMGISAWTNTAFDEKLKFTKGKSDWLIFNSGHSAHICADRSAFTSYHEYGPTEPRFSWYWIREGTAEESKGEAVAKGKGKVAVSIDYDNDETETLMFDAYYYPDLRFSIFFAKNAAKDHKLKFDRATRGFCDMDKDMLPLGGTVLENGFPFLRKSTEGFNSAE